MKYQPDSHKKRWIVYFDLLGIRKMISEGKEVQVFAAYKHALEQFGHHKTWAPSLEHGWFSDSFLILAPDDSKDSFGRIDLMARYFVNTMLIAKIPLRGAISCGDMYVDPAEKVFLGKGLVEAYEYGEGQDWIGLLLCPTATERLESLGMMPDPSDYKLWRIPWKRQPEGAPHDLFACFVGKVVLLGGHNPRIESLEEMMSGVSREDQRVKYERTMAFLRRNERIS